MWVKFSKFILKNRLLLLCILLLFSIFIGFKGSEVKMSYDIINMLPKENEDNNNYKKFKQKFGKDGNLIIIALKDDYFFQIENFNKWYDFTNKIKNIKINYQGGNQKIVEDVLSISNIYFPYKDDSLQKIRLRKLVNNKLKNQSELDSIIEVLDKIPFYNNLIYKKEKSFISMILYVNQEILSSKERKLFFKQLDILITQFENDTKIDLKVSGLPYIRNVSTNLVAKEMMFFVILTIIVICLLLIFIFRSFKVMFFSLLVVSIGVIWSLGITGLLGYKITIVSATIPPLILVIGIPNCVFLINKYYKEYANYKNKIKSLLYVIQRMGKSVFLTNLTTAIGFFAFVFTGNKNLVEFGIVAFLSVIGLFILSISFIPIIYSYLPAPKNKHIKHLQSHFIITVISKIDELIFSKRKWIYLSFIVLLLIAFIGISRLKVSGRFSEDLPRNNLITEDLEFFNENFSGVMPFNVMIETNKKNGLFENNAKAIYRIKKFQNKAKKINLLSSPLSIIDAIKFSYQAYKSGEKKYYILPSISELKKLKYYLPSNKKTNGQRTLGKTLNAFVDTNYSCARISYRIKDISTKQMDSLTKEIDTLIYNTFKDTDYKVFYTGATHVFLSGSKYLTKNLIMTMLISILLIGLFMATLFNSWQMIIISIIPNLIPLIFIAGLMGFVGISIKPSTMLVFSIVFGIAVDDSIHFLSKFKQEYIRHSRNINQAVHYALKETSSSMIYTSIILFTGFSVFLISSFGGTIALGFLLPLTIIFAIFCDLILLPSLLLSFNKIIIQKALKKEPLIDLINEEIDIDLENLEIKK